MNLLAVLPADGDARAPGQHLIDAAQLAADQNSKLLSYASNEHAIAEAVAAGLVAKPGFITVTIANVQALSAAVSNALEVGAATSACLAMLRAFHVENGDRM